MDPTSLNLSPKEVMNRMWFEFELKLDVTQKSNISHSHTLCYLMKKKLSMYTKKNVCVNKIETLCVIQETLHACVFQ